MLQFFQEFDEISEHAKNFISSTVVKKKEHRLSADQCVSHPWLTRYSIHSRFSRRVTARGSCTGCSELRMILQFLWTKLCSFGNLVPKKATSQGITNLFVPLCTCCQLSINACCHLFVLSLTTTILHLYRSLVHFVGLKKTVAKMVPGCLRMMKSCHIYFK